MKVAQNDETNPTTQSVRSPHAPSMLNMELSPSFPLSGKRQTPENPPDVFPLRLQHVVLR